MSTELKCPFNHGKSTGAPVAAGMGPAFFRPAALAKLLVFVIGTSLAAGVTSLGPWQGFTRATNVTGVGLIFAFFLGYIFRLRLMRV